MTRAVVTGVGVVAPSGIGAEDHWRSLLAGTLHVRPIEGWDASAYGTTLAGQVRGFVAADHVEERLLVQTDRWTWMSLAAAQMALDDAGYDPAAHSPYATSVVLSAGSGGNEFGQREIQALWGGGPRMVSAYQSIAWFYAASTGQTSIRHGTKGPASVLVSEAAGGLDSLGYARRVIRRGTPVVLAGGTEAPLSPYALACQSTNGRMTTRRDPRDGYKPFDVRANGYAPGEGGAVLVVEDLSAADERGAPRVYGEIVGYAATHDAYHHQDPAPDGRQLARAMERALADAALTPDDVDLVIADGAGISILDALEAQALGRVFGSRSRPVSVTAPQGFVGRLNAGGSALNVATALLAMRDQVVPAVGNLDDPAP
ncbi:MAG TPA: beta-ketoacyl synthase N-terminal-like domain-containing protein, partial [Frankiaceae bacterium]|nr:beta-ketoacyl synthase N-terminal-like domain-containing protein [Frankiaceae bacterium]